MTGRQTHKQLIAQGEIVSAPAERACRDQSFELPTGIYAAMAVMFAGFITVLALAFRVGHMPVVVGVTFAFLTAYFAVPTIFPLVASGQTGAKALSWLQFRKQGIVTATGHCTAREATTLVLLLPFLILLFGIAVVAISALV